MSIEYIKVIDRDSSVCTVTSHTLNSVEVFMKRKTNAGVDCRQWFSKSDFEKRFKPDFYDSLAFECEKRVEWFVRGINRHCLSPEVFSIIPTETLCDMYNVELEYFKLTTDKYFN